VLLGTLVQQVFWIFEALEATRVACDQALRELDRGGNNSLSPPSIKRLRLESPLDLLLEGSNPYVIGAVLLVGRMLTYRKKFHEGSMAKQEARRLRWEQDQREIKAAVKTNEIAKRILDDLKALLPDESSSVSDEALTELAESLGDHALPHILRLVESAEDVDVVGPDDPEETGQDR
jgi:hypothetical protein